MNLVEFEQKIYLRLIEKSYLFNGDVSLDGLADTAMLAAKILEDKQRKRHINNLPPYDPKRHYGGCARVRHNGEERTAFGVGSLEDYP